MKIGIFSSASFKVSSKNKKLAKDLAEYMTKKGMEVVTGGSLGIPGVVAEHTYKIGGKTSAYSPDRNKKTHHERHDNHSLDFYHGKKFIPGFTARSLVMIKNIDGAIVLNGRIGTLSEFTIAIEEGLPVSVLEGTGGITDHLKKIIKISKKKYSKDKIYFTSSYKKAVDNLIKLKSSEK